MNTLPHLLMLAVMGLLPSCSTGELPSSTSEQASIAMIFYANDTNKDNCLSKSEWHRMVDISVKGIDNEASNIDQFRDENLRLFTEMDFNSDNCITVREYRRFSDRSREANFD